jgi:serine/threonine-protein kinase HipA
MRRLMIQIELSGENILVGEIIGNNSDDACFTYDDSYVENPKHRSISISLPKARRTFDAHTTRNFFEGLLPEGFTRRCIAEWMHTQENDYLSILSGLGRECLGAIKVIEEDLLDTHSEYRRLTKDQVQKLAKEGATESAELVTKSHLSLTGASGKVGLYYDGKDWFLPIGDAPSTHIVKQSHVRLKKIVWNEQLCLMTAKKLGIEVPDSFIIDMETTDDENVLFATARYDRKINDGCRKLHGLPMPYRMHQEDFSQALGISAADKYEQDHTGYMKKIFDVVRNYSSDPITDQIKLWDICVFNYLIGNTDNHIKNISLLYSEDLKSIRLAPAYDIVSTMIYENSTENMAISIGGIYNIHDITTEAFEKEAVNIGLGKHMAMKRFEAMSIRFPEALRMAASELKEQGFDGIEEIYEEILRKRNGNDK